MELTSYVLLKHFLKNLSFWNNLKHYVGIQYFQNCVKLFWKGIDKKRESSPKVLHKPVFKTFIWEREDCEYWIYFTCFFPAPLLTMGNLYICLFLIILREMLYRQGTHFHFPCCWSTSPSLHKLWFFGCWWNSNIIFLGFSKQKTLRFT